MALRVLIRPLLKLPTYESHPDPFDLRLTEVSASGCVSLSPHDDQRAIRTRM